MPAQVKRLIVGAPIPSHLAHRERFSRVTGLAVLSSDPLSSVAYATEEILRVLAIGGVAALGLVTPIGAVIAAMLAVVVFSYRQTIYAYPNGGGAYIVAKDNLGRLPSRIAAAALLIDYVLTVSVSIAARVVEHLGSGCQARRACVSVSLVDGATPRVHRGRTGRKCKRVCDGDPAGIRAASHLARLTPQSTRAAHQGCAALQAERHRDERAVPSRATRIACRDERPAESSCIDDLIGDCRRVRDGSGRRTCRTAA
jgi:hypothetical protein